MDRGSDLHRLHEVHAKYLGSREDVYVAQTLYTILGKGLGSSKEQGPVGAQPVPPLNSQPSGRAA